MIHIIYIHQKTHTYKITCTLLLIFDDNRGDGGNGNVLAQPITRSQATHRATQDRVIAAAAANEYDT